MLLPPESSSSVLLMISNKYVHISNRFYSRQIDNGKMTTFGGNINLLTQQHKNVFTKKTTAFVAVHGKKNNSRLWLAPL